MCPDRATRAIGAGGLDARFTGRERRGGTPTPHPGCRRSQRLVSIDLSANSIAWFPDSHPQDQHHCHDGRGAYGGYRNEELGCHRRWLHLADRRSGSACCRSVFLTKGLSMIVVRLCGGLGNQLFQYAAGRQLAQARCTELVLDLGWYRRTPSSNTPRKFELNHGLINTRSAVGTEYWWCQLHGGRLLRHIPFIPRKWRIFREKSFDFDNSFLDLPDNTYLDGYWQSYKYFEDIADVIRAEIMLLLPASPKDMVFQEGIVATESVSIHVRRGDYVTQKAAVTTHGTCSLEYYHAALAKLKTLVCNPHFFFFSDDIEWSQQQFASLGSVTFVGHNGPDAACQDLRLMTLCKHHVIANSSFSWWGAWLNPGKEKIVVAPKVWFSDGCPTPTLIPDPWIQL